ncbi:MAG: hypothetical protein JSR76_07210 [Verrucomicrobia bacterium]|nr:hypothetical protein [Verrucomicrobiota bacterium]
MNSSFLLRKISHIYQYGYWCWNMEYSGLGSEEIAYSFTREYRFLCQKDSYSPEWEEILSTLPKKLESEGRILQKHPYSRTTYLLTIGGKPYVVKASHKKPKLYCLLFPSRYSRIAWNNAKLSRKLGLPAFTPTALVEFGQGLQVTSYLIYPFLGTTLVERPSSEEWLYKLQETIDKQKELHLIHPDFRPTNVVLLEDGSIQYIDIDEMHRYSAYSYLFLARLKKEIKRFETLMQEKETDFSIDAERLLSL